jgi:uncharacterized membrane protein
MIFFDVFLMYIKDAIGAIGVIVIMIGTIRSIYQLILGAIHKDFATNYVRLQFGNSIILGLEFMVGADIVGSLVKPDYYNLGLLAILVLIRTILSYFLNLELENLTPEQRQEIK